MERRKSSVVNIESVKQSFKDEFPEEYKHLDKFLKSLSLGQLTRTEVTPEGQVKYIQVLKVFFRNIKKPVGKLSKKDMQDFITALKNDKIKKLNKTTYSDRTKVDIKTNIKIYLKWRLPSKYHNIASWIKTKVPKKDPITLTEKEVLSLYNKCKSSEQRFILAVLFDTGARAGEFLNIRAEDITAPTKEFPYYKINFKEEFSKTNGRNIGLYWKHSSEAIKQHLAEIGNIDPETPVCSKDYDALRMFLTRLGKKVLNKRIHFHMFRKTSATHYASKLNRQQLCIRYGWAFSSDMPDVYIKRAGIEEEELKEKMFNSDLEELGKENKETKTKIAIQQKEIEDQKERIDQLIYFVTQVYEGENKDAFLEQFKALQH